MNNQAAQTMPVSEEWALRAMAKNYGDGPHRWDKLDREVCERAAEEIKSLRERVAALSQTAGVADGMVMVQKHDLEWIVAHVLDECDGSGPCADLAARRVRALLAAAPAASGGEDEMCPNCVTPWKCNGPHESPAGTSVSERAREILSQAYRDAGFDKAAEWVLHVDLDNELYVLDHAVIRALEQALTQQRGESGSDLERRISTIEDEGERIDALVQWLNQQEKNCGALSIAAATIRAMYTTIKYTTPQPGAEALRELVQSWRFMSDPYHGKCADELESLLARGGKEDWFGDVLSTLGDSVPLGKGD